MACPQKSSSTQCGPENSISITVSNSRSKTSRACNAYACNIRHAAALPALLSWSRMHCKHKQHEAKRAGAMRMVRGIHDPAPGTLQTPRARHAIAARQALAWQPHIMTCCVRKKTSGGRPPRASQQVLEANSGCGCHAYAPAPPRPACLGHHSHTARHYVITSGRPTQLHTYHPVELHANEHHQETRECLRRHRCFCY